MQKISIKALFCRDQRFLFLKDQKGKWELPGGKLEFGESPEQALTRELREELGWNSVSIETIFDAWTFVVQKTEGDVQYVILTFVCSVGEQAIHACDEYQEYAWMDVQQVKDAEMRDGYKQTVDRFIKARKSL